MKEYRLLKNGEKIKEGDEGRWSGWNKVFGAIGAIIGESPFDKGSVRRPIPAKSARKAQNKPQGKTPRKTKGQKRGASPKLAGSKLK